MTFDLEKAREVCKTLPKYMNGACPCKEEAEAAKMLIKALPEIERLRATLARVNQARETEIDQAGAAERIYLEAARLKDTRIQELEDALVEEGTKGLFNGPWDSGLSCGGYDEEMAACRREARRRLQAEGKIGPDTEPANIRALQRVMRKQHDHPAEMAELNADHQYPPDTPRSWQITEERKEALDRVLNYMDYMYPKSSPYYHCALDVSVLRAMLEAGQ